MVEALLEAGADPMLLDAQGRSALHYAQDKKSVELLHAAGVDIHSRDQRGDTPLHTIRKRSAAEGLLDAGADINAPGKWMPDHTPMHTAAMSGNVPLVLMLAGLSVLPGEVIHSLDAGVRYPMPPCSLKLL